MWLLYLQPPFFAMNVSIICICQHYMYSASYDMQGAETAPFIDGKIESERKSLLAQVLLTYPWQSLE